ncbi:MAG: sigma-70 family RNA polymerase sigma factor [Terrimicrobiaceae bacterium]|nr:sigma-70 family RNA polymerase sigma factor [Terrimicrobiaceae bacterium]
MDEHGSPEKEWLERSRRGDTHAFDQIVTAYRSAVFARIVQIVRNPDDAHDLAQDTFVRAWKSLAKFDGRHAFSSWLLRIATNAAIDHCRRMHHRASEEWDEQSPSADSRTTPAASPRPDTQADEPEIRRRIEQAIGELSPDQRAVLLLREVEGLSYEEIAAELSCSMGTVMSRLFHARKKMQLLLKDLRDAL